MFINIATLAPFLADTRVPVRAQNHAILPKRFEDLLPATAWARLPEQIRKRFAGHVAIGQNRLYSGIIISTHLSFWGLVLAYLLVPFGAPLPLNNATGGQAAIVAVTAQHAKTGQDAQVWTRQYSRDNGFPQTIHSTKRLAGPTGLEERLGPGLGQCIGISLVLEADEGALAFISTRYFFWLLGTRLFLPKWLEPGTMVVSHEMVGQNQFIFRLKLTHPKLGVLVEQVCLFHDTTEV